MLRKSEIENLAAGFRVEVIAAIMKYRGSKALGVVGSFVADLEAHRIRYAEKIAVIRAGADAATIALANEIERKIDVLAHREIQRVRGVGRVDFDPDEELPLSQQRPQSHVRGHSTSVGSRNASPVLEPTMAAEAGPDKYPPHESGGPGQLDDIERITFLRHRQSQAGPVNERSIENMNAIIQRATSLSLDDIDQVIHALQRLRDMVRKEGERVCREVAGYASLRHAAVAAMKIMADCIKKWEEGADAGPHSNTG